MRLRQSFGLIIFTHIVIVCEQQLVKSKEIKIAEIFWKMLAFWVKFAEDFNYFSVI